MSVRTYVCTSLLALTLTGCFHPPYNNFERPPPNIKPAITGTVVGAVAGGLLGGSAMGAVVGGVAGASLGTFSEIQHAGKPAIIDDLQKDDIQFVQHGDTMVLIIPTDHYYQFGSARLNDLCFDGLNNVVKLLKLYNCSVVYVAGFTDNVGTRKHKKSLTQARAETMVTFLWANNIRAKSLKAEGYGDEFDVGDNHWIHGSAYNRRIEIQWQNKATTPPMAAPLTNGMK